MWIYNNDTTVWGRNVNIRPTTACDKNRYLSFGSRDISRENKFRTRNNLPIHRRTHRYTCGIHKPILLQGLNEDVSVRKRCIECLCSPVYAYVNRYEIIGVDHNYIFPMLCNNCSDILVACKWCRPRSHKFMISY